MQRVAEGVIASQASIKEKEEEKHDVMTNVNVAESKSKQHTEEDDGFKKVVYRRNKKQNIDPKIRPSCVEGTKEDVSSLRAVKARNLSWLFVSRLAEDTRDEDVKNYLKTNGFPNCECETILTKKRRYYRSFKLGIPTDRKSEVLDPSFWPKGVLINDFLNLKRIVSTNRRISARDRS